MLPYNKSLWPASNINASAAKTNVSNNNVSDLEEKITILQEKLEAVNERFRRVDNVNTVAGSNANIKTYNNLEQLHQSQSRLEEILTTLIDRVAILEREESTMMATINEIQQVLSQQEKNVSSRRASRALRSSGLRKSA